MNNFCIILSCKNELKTGSGPAVSLKGFRTLSKRFFWNGGTILQFTPEGVRPGIMSSKDFSKEVL